jgi:hypothetical protein
MLLFFGTVDGIVVGIGFVNGHTFHPFDVGAVCREYPPQQAEKEQKEYNKRDHRPYLDVFDALQYILIHGGIIDCRLLSQF